MDEIKFESFYRFRDIANGRFQFKYDTIPKNMGQWIISSATQRNSRSIYSIIGFQILRIQINYGKIISAAANGRFHVKSATFWRIYHWPGQTWQIYRCLYCDSEYIIILRLLYFLSGPFLVEHTTFRKSSNTSAPIPQTFCPLRSRWY